MIDDATIKRIAAQCGAITLTGIAYPERKQFTEEQLASFATACYAAGQDAQRESDAKICAGLDLNYAMHTGYDCSKEILANTEP